MASGEFHAHHEALHKQIVAFEKMLQHAMNRFSRDKLFHMLQVLSKKLDLHEDAMTRNTTVHIESVQHLKTVVQLLQQRHAGRDVIPEEDRHVLHYFTTFFEDLQYLNGLRRYFDEKVYICLYEYFYDPSDDVEAQCAAVTSRAQKNELTEASSDSMSASDDVTTPLLNHNNSAAHKQEEEEEEIIFDFLSKQAKLSVAVQKMYKVNSKWGLIVDESNPNLSAYDPDSKHELASYPHAKRYEAILRLLPDIFVKAYKSIELAKLWWSQAQKLYAGKPFKKRSIKELVREEVETEHRIVKIEEDIERFESTLLVRSDDLVKLSERESRFQTLSEQCEKLDQRKDSATQAYNSILAQVESMNDEIELYQKGTKEYNDIEKRLKFTDKQLALTEDELKILAYHFHIVQEDFNLEMELQPHLIRFRADIEDKINDLENDLRVKQTEKRNTAKKIVLLKANCERMREIMHRYNLAETSDVVGASREGTEHVTDENHNPANDNKRNIGNKENKEKEKGNKTNQTRDRRKAPATRKDTGSSNSSSKSVLTK